MSNLGDEVDQYLKIAMNQEIYFKLITSGVIVKFSTLN